ncbi:hypothetical protein K503DRAFT_778037 [Rhizopogon vinicolor AM-OR11-026]|uniref:Uncharacterized protein n=1 Tax=Rhizopogon vinicolor AM-OR11-026 TaxID=1314800 RepID=A0A1B7MDX0_9AGAM|nr:hypothetical protein K503DRAFT_778037 [Rhizopogon vinicolor AM-OR11-026]
MIFNGVGQVVSFAQMFVLGPRLILSVRQYNAKLVESFDAGTGMIAIAFQEQLHVSIDGDV